MKHYVKKASFVISPSLPARCTVLFTVLCTVPAMSLFYTVLLHSVYYSTRSTVSLYCATGHYAAAVSVTFTVSLCLQYPCGHFCTVPLYLSSYWSVCHCICYCTVSLTVPAIYLLLFLYCVTVSVMCCVTVPVISLYPFM